jgi:hypothetical protein
MAPPIVNIARSIEPLAFALEVHQRRLQPNLSKPKVVRQPPGATAKNIAAVETEHSVVLPASLVQLLRAADGLILRSAKIYQMLSTRDLVGANYAQHVARAHELNPGQQPRGLLIATNPFSGKRLWMEVKGQKATRDAPVAVWGPSRKTPERYATLEAFLCAIYKDLDEASADVAAMSLADAEARAARKAPAVHRYAPTVRRTLRPLVADGWTEGPDCLHDLAALGVPKRLAESAVWLLEMMTYAEGDAGSERLGHGKKDLLGAIALVRKSKSLPALTDWLVNISTLRSRSEIDDALEMMARTFGADGMVRPVAEILAAGIKEPTASRRR